MSALAKDVRTCTSSSDLIQKKRALINLAKLIFTSSSADFKPSISESTFPSYFTSSLFPALLKTCTDDKEKIRELSLNLLLKIVGCKEMEGFDFSETLKVFSDDVFKRGTVPLRSALRSVKSPN